MKHASVHNGSGGGMGWWGVGEGVKRYVKRGKATVSVLILQVGLHEMHIYP